MDQMGYMSVDSLLGPIRVAWDERGIHVVQLRSDEDVFVSTLRRWLPPGILPVPGFYPDIADQIEAYFAGSLRQFVLPLHLGGTPFQMTVWEALQRIPYGETRSYQDVARDVGNPAAVRAVGGANANNPIPLVVPCHRVIRKNGALGGFSSGVDIKKWLLNFEAHMAHTDTEGPP